MIDLHTFEHRKAFVDAVVEAISREIGHAGKTFSLGLSGGSTPRPVYEALSRRPDIDWGKIHLYQVDERCVPSDHPDSNARMIRESIVGRVHPAPVFHAFDTTLSVEDSLKQYENKLRKLKHRAFDLILLGMGPDGHIASLFPKSPTLMQTQHLTALSRTRRFAVYRRLTITPPVIMHSRQLFLLLAGADKEPILSRLLHSRSTPRYFPAMLLHQHSHVHIFYSKR